MQTVMTAPLEGDQNWCTESWRQAGVAADASIADYDIFRYCLYTLRVTSML